MTSASNSASGRSFLRLTDRSAAELLALAEHAARLNAAFADRRLPPLLAGRRVAFWWDGPGFRNRVAFELGVASMGGLAVSVPGSVGEGEATGDVAGYLGNWFDLIVVRTPSIARLSELAEAGSVPVINARTEHNHPCEILGDLAWLHASGRRIDEPLTVVFVGPAANMLHSWIEAAHVLPISVIQVCPDGFEFDPRLWANTGSGAGGSPPVGSVEVVNSFGEELDRADVVYTDCWPTEQRTRFAPLQVTAAVLDRCPADVAFLPCPPVTRGQEVSDDAMVHASSRVVEAKAWLLSAQNALLADCVSDGAYQALSK